MFRNRGVKALVTLFCNFSIEPWDMGSGDPHGPAQSNPLASAVTAAFFKITSLVFALPVGMLYAQRVDAGKLLFSIDTFF